MDMHKFNKSKFPQGDPDARLGFMAMKRKTKHFKEQQLELFDTSCASLPVEEAFR